MHKVPPNGVRVESHCRCVSENKYKEPQKKVVPTKNVIPARLEGVGASPANIMPNE